MSRRSLRTGSPLIRRTGSLRPLLAAVTLAAAASAGADNAELQALFFAACDDPSAGLAARCGETTDGLGDLSGDSESSLNPSQSLNGTSATQAAARSRNEEARERGDRYLHGEEPGAAEGALALGPFSLLLNGNYQSEEQSRTVDVDAERGYQLDAWGAQLGFDYRLSPGLVAGAVVSWETSDLEFDREQAGVNFTPQGDAGEVAQDSLGFSVFANVLLGEHGYLDLSAGYVDSDYTVRRRSVFQESGRSVPQTNVLTRATPGGDETWAAFNLGYAAAIGAWAVDPYLGAVYSKAQVDAYEETDQSDSGLAMSISQATSRTVLGQAGVRVARPISRQGYVLLPQASLEYLRAFDRDGVETRASYRLDQNGNVLALEGDRRDRDFFEAGIGVVMLLPNGWMPFLEYQVTLGAEDLDAHRVAVGLRVEL